MPGQNAESGINGARTIRSKSLIGILASDALRKGQYAYEKMNRQPRLAIANGYGNPTGTTGDTNYAHFRRFSAAYHVKGTQTLLGPLMDVNAGLDVSQDQTDNDGVEYLFGSHVGTSNPFRTIVGTDQARFIRVRFKIADVSGTDDCCVGWRKLEAFQANVDDYDEAAFLNVILGNIYTEKILNNAATASVDTGKDWTDGETHELEVRLIGQKAYFFVDGVEVGTPHTFDAGEVVAPFFFFLQATTSPGKVYWDEVEIGDLEQVKKDRSKK